MLVRFSGAVRRPADDASTPGVNVGALSLLVELAHGGADHQRRASRAGTERPSGS